jgi:hypothetical protein
MPIYNFNLKVKTGVKTDLSVECTPSWSNKLMKFKGFRFEIRDKKLAEDIKHYVLSGILEAMSLERMESR